MTREFDDAVEACMTGNAAVVRKWISVGNDVNSVDEYGRTLIFYVLSAGSSEILQDLIAAGAQVDFQDSYGNTPLGRAVFESRGSKDVIDILLQAGANPDVTNKSGVSPRMLAATISNFDLTGIFD